MPTYLAYHRDDKGVVSPVKVDTIDERAQFWPDGNIYSLKGINLGYNGSIYGTKVDNLFNFNKNLLDEKGQAFPLGEFGKLVPQPNGSVAIEWPLP